MTTPTRSTPSRSFLGFFFPRSAAPHAPGATPRGRLARTSPWPYAKRPLFSPAEARFYRVLQQAVGDGYLVFPKVNLADLLGVKRRTLTPRAWRAKIDRKHADYVLVNHKTLAALAVIELDDARQRDAVINQALDAAEIPLIRIRARPGYLVEEVREELRAGLRG